MSGDFMIDGSVDIETGALTVQFHFAKTLNLSQPPFFKEVVQLYVGRQKCGARKHASSLEA